LKATELNAWDSLEAVQKTLLSSDIGKRKKITCGKHWINTPHMKL